MNYRGLKRRLNRLADTKRKVLTGSKFAHAEYLINVKCSSIYPLGSDIKLRMGLDTPHQIFEVYTETVDIETGDVFVFSNVDYPIRAVEKWPFSDGRFLRLVVEGLKI